VGRIKASALERNQNQLLFGLEDFHRHTARCSMNPTSGDVPAPDQRAACHVAQIDECLALEEAFPDKTHGIFDHRFILGMPRPGRVGKKTSVVGVLQKRPVKPRGAGIGFIQTCFHTVDDHPPWTSA